MYLWGPPPSDGPHSHPVLYRRRRMSSSIDETLTAQDVSVTVYDLPGAPI